MTARAGRPPISIGRLAVFAVLAFAVIFYGVPLLWLFVAGTRSQASLYSGSPYDIGDWATMAKTWSNLTTYNSFEMLNWAGNSVIYAVGGVALSLLTAIPAGYVLALYEFPGRKLLLVLTLIAIITPSSAIVLPIFLEMTLIGLNNTYLGLILATGFFPFGVYLAYIYYVTALPVGLLEAARVDGANELQTFLKIAMPLAKPIIALVFFFSFVSNWNNFFLPYVFLTDQDKAPITVGLYNLLASTPAFNPAVGGGGQSTNIFKPELALATVIAVIPVAIVFVASQRALVRGLVGGGVKE